jgi:hypothetical protein
MSKKKPAVVLGVYTPERIQAAIDSVRAQGGEVVPHGYGVRYCTKTKRWIGERDPPRCCALGALLLSEQPGVADGATYASDRLRMTGNQTLGVSAAWVRNFEKGFDGHTLMELGNGSAAGYEAGRKARGYVFGFDV